MNRKNYTKIIKENHNITYKAIIKKFECEKCNKCKHYKLLNVCSIALQTAVKLWNKGYA